MGLSSCPAGKMRSRSSTCRDFGWAILKPQKFPEILARLLWFCNLSQNFHPKRLPHRDFPPFPELQGQRGSALNIKGLWERHGAFLTQIVLAVINEPTQPPLLRNVTTSQRSQVKNSEISGKSGFFRPSRIRNAKFCPAKSQARRLCLH